MTGRFGLVFLGLLTLVGCRSNDSTGEGGDAGARIEDARLRALLGAEASRNIRRVDPSLASSRDPRLRRARARALARSGDPDARPALVHALSDSDLTVIAWSAYGLGELCTSDNDQDTVSRLTLRAAALLSAQSPGTNADPLSGPATKPNLDPWYALADALGRCASPLAERTLRGWLRLGGSVAEAAALGLGRAASETRHLDTSTLVALLDASEAKDPVSTALYPLSRLSHLDEMVKNRLLQLVTKLIKSSGHSRRFAIRAASLCGLGAAPLLQGVLLDPSRYDMAERADAARGLANLGEAGQQALGRVLAHLSVSVSANHAALVSSQWGPLIETLEGLDQVVPEAVDSLAKLANLPAPDGESEIAVRRTTRLRCAAAALLAANNPNSRRLLACDPDPNGSYGQLALLEVLDRGSLSSDRARRFVALANAKSPEVRMQALRILGRHPDFPDTADVLTSALSSSSQGVVAVASTVLTEQPELANSAATSPQGRRSSVHSGSRNTPRDRLRPAPKLLAALLDAFERTWPEDAIEVRVRLMDAAGALGALSVKPSLDRACGSKLVVMRQAAERALRALGEPTRRCPRPPPQAMNLPPLALSGSFRLKFDTDVGPLELTLDARFAPLAVHRVLALVGSGFYDHIRVHRAVPGFVVQLGDRGADGYGGTDRPPLVSEPTPLPFSKGDVGMATTGADTASSQFFVTLGPYPHIGGQNAWIGRAGDAWDLLSEGDLIRRVSLLP